MCEESLSQPSGIGELSLPYSDIGKQSFSYKEFGFFDNLTRKKLFFVRNHSRLITAFFFKFLWALMYRSMCAFIALFFNSSKNKA